MDERKQSANWKIALRHAFKSIVLMPLLFIVVTIYPLIIATQIISWKVVKGNEESLAFELSVVMMIAIWVGVRWSAKRIERKNIVSDSGKIINISLAFVIGIFVLDRLSKMLKQME
ncbi:MAG: hypothetical protein US16_C0051G0012 [Candidatus Moranbacteria bacterium GW2011_GWE2_36_40]|nr:MAG: hypothetical protein US16_C0051G0012 [Candidatus Moranbacteria bacterium GW2011_GWE2_36_40]